MPFDPQAPDLKVAVVGTGAMGRGIAQIAAQSGCTVLLFDAQPEAAAKAREALQHTFETLAAKGKLTADAAAAAADRLRVEHDLGGLAPAEVVVEAIVEDLDVKRRLFRELEDIVSSETVLASNTSSLSITAIATACRRPERVAGLHFFNPVPLMKVAEVIDGLRSDRAVGDALMGLVRRFGHQPVRALDTPGFIVNHAGRGYNTEALKLLGEGVAGVQAIDEVLREQAGFRMGPFELMDLTGLDVSQPVMESIYRQFYDEPRYRPSALAALRRTGGLLGRKTGEGFYRYDGGQQAREAPVAAPAARPHSVWVADLVPDWAEQARQLAASLGAAVEHTAVPSEQALIVVTPCGEDVSFVCTRHGWDARRTIGLDMLVPQAKRRTVVLNPLTQPGQRDAAAGLFGADGVPVSLVRDSVGLVAQRVLACVVNIGCDIAQQGIATPADIDLAVQLGLGYPRGPLAWGDALGPRRLLAILEHMTAITGDPRYRPSPWLRRRAHLGVSLTTPEPAL